MKRALLNLSYVGLGGLIAFGALQFVPSYGETEKNPPAKVAVDTTPLEREGKFTTSFAPVIKKAAPSVVNIYTTKKATERDLRSHPFFNDPLFREFFGDPGERPRPPRQEQSLGSGVIVSSNGYILTSNHVIEGADEIRIVMADGTEFTAKTVGGDSATDSAVLKVEATDLPAITLADSDKLEVGDLVLAIGNPFGIGQTVTMGIVSAMGRGELGIVDYEDFIQTDAPINMGNSGGALVDAQGRLVGINTAILSRTGGNQGVGFAVPVNLSKSVMDRLIAEGKVRRGFLGVGLYPGRIPPDLAERLELNNQSGALISGVEEGTPAAEAGFKPYDLIVEFNGKPVEDSRQLRLMVSQTMPGTKVHFKVQREGKTRTIEVKLAELPTERTLGGMMRRSVPEQPENETLGGVEVTDLDREARRQIQIPNHIQGALVTSVDPSSNAFEAGLRQGDVILEIERQPVTNAEEAIELSDKFEGDKVLLRVWSRGIARVLLVPVDRRESQTQEREQE